MTDIFVSYASEDLERVQPLVAALLEHGWSVWWDRELVAGPSYEDKIEEALDAASCVVVVWSSQSIKSQWVRTEAHEGLEREILIPLLIDEVKPPLAYRIAQTANMIDWPDQVGELDSVIDGITNLLSKPRILVDQQQDSIAVLPFVNMSNESSQDYFSEGISEDILNALVNYSSLKVIARTSSFQFRGRDLDIRRIGDQLNVTHVLEGSVRKAGDRIRVTAQLNTTTDGSHLWSEQYDRNLSVSNIFALQDEITAAILAALNIHFATPESSGYPTTSIEAYNHVLSSRQLMGAVNFSAAITSAKKAISIDSNYSDAYALCAISLVGNQTLKPTQPKDVFPEVHLNLDRALSLDPNNQPAKQLDAYLLFFEKLKYQQSLDLFAELGSSVTNAHSPYSNVLCALGKYELMDQFINRQLELDPLYAMAYLGKFALLMTRGRTTEALECLKRAEILGMDCWGNYTLAAICMGDLKECKSRIDAGRDRFGRQEIHYDIYNALYCYMSGDQSSALRIMDTNVDPASHSQNYQMWRSLITGDLEGAVDCHIRGVQELEFFFLSGIQGRLMVKELFPELYTHPAYHKLLKDLRLDAESIARLRIPELSF